MKIKFICCLCVCGVFSSGLYGQGFPSVIAKQMLERTAKEKAVARPAKMYSAQAARLSHLHRLAQDNFEELNVMLEDYFTLNPQKASAWQLRENKKLQEQLVRNWLERDFYASQRVLPCRKGVSFAVSRRIDFLQYIPSSARLVVFGEIHEQDWMVNALETAVWQLKKVYPHRNIYYASEFVNAAPGKDLYILSGGKDAEIFVTKRPYYRAVTNRMIEAGVRVVGLEDPALSRQLQQTGYSRNFHNTPLAWQTVSAIGVRERNQYWAQIIGRIYEQDPEALVVVHAGLGHTNYNQPNPLPRLLKKYSPFVVEFTDLRLGNFNTLLEKYAVFPLDILQEAVTYRIQQSQQPVFLLRQMKDKRMALVAGCDLNIRRW